MNKNPVVFVVSNTNENDKIETCESESKRSENAVEKINKHLKTKSNNENGLSNDGCVIIGCLQNNNKENGYQNVGDKEKTGKSLEQNNVTKTLTNKDDEINILEAVTTEKIEPNSTASCSKDLTDNLCVAGSSSIKCNQGVKSKVINIDGKTSDLNNVTKVKQNELEQRFTPCTGGFRLQGTNDSSACNRKQNDSKLFREKLVKMFIPNTVTKSPWPFCTAGINENFDFTLERYDVKLFRNDFEKLIFSNTIFTSKQNDVLLNVFEEQILINTITKKPRINSSTADKINCDSILSSKLEEYHNLMKEMMPNNPLYSEENLLRDKFETFFCYNTILTPEQNDLLRNEFENQIFIKNSTGVSFKGINNGCVSAGANVVVNQSADKTKNVISGENQDELIEIDELIKIFAYTKKPQENAINVNNNKPNLKLTSKFNEPQRIISNIQSFDCKICFNTCEPYNGIILQNCGHLFCLECIRNFIKSCESIIVECPHINDHQNIKCKEQINESEILGILSPKEIEIYRERQFERNVQSVGSIPCCTINCKGFYINEKDETFFSCYICKIVNCIACKATHRGMSCHQYKESIDPNLKLSNAYLQNRKLDGLAMDCPSCGAIVERTDGCEGMQCIICKTDLCWATKGLRWGPGGKGDTSAGCRCNVNGKRCHPTCNNCH